MSHPARRTPAVVLLAAIVLLALAHVAPPAGAAPGPSPLGAQPNVQSFGLVNVNQGEQSSSIWVQNNGPDPVTVGESTIVGSSDFRVSNDQCKGQMLSSGQGCNVGVGFDPSDASASSATLHVPAAGYDDLQVPLAGEGGAQHLTLSPATLDFGSVSLGEGAMRTVTLTNDGDYPFQSIAALPSSGDVGAFRVLQDDCSLRELQRGETCTISIRFQPLATGAATATLLLVGGNDNPLMISVRGAGAAVPAVAPPATAPAPPAAATVALADPARLLFAARSGAAAPVTNGRIDLGIARCDGAPRCRVSARARVFAVGPDGVTIVSVRSDVVLWRVRDAGRPLSLGLPAGLRGTPSLLVARLRTHAAGHRTGTRTLVVRLVARDG